MVTVHQSVEKLLGVQYSLTPDAQNQNGNRSQMSQMPHDAQNQNRYPMNMMKACCNLRLSISHRCPNINTGRTLAGLHHIIREQPRAIQKVGGLYPKMTKFFLN